MFSSFKNASAILTAIENVAKQGHFLDYIAYFHETARKELV